MKSVLKGLRIIGFCLITSCSNKAAQVSWVPIVTGPPMPPVNVQDVLLIDDYPVAEYVSIGRMEPADGVSESLDHDDQTIQALKEKAAAMGGNTLVVRPNLLKFKSGKGGGNRVDVIYVREEMGTHGGDDWSSGDSVPLNEDLLKIY